MHDIIRLRNGIKLIHSEIKSPVSHFGILVNAGTRDEPSDKMGLAHFVEHTIFKGTKKRKSFQVIKRLEDVGGELNASTSKEETYFHASFLSQDYARAVELLSDIFFNSTFPEKELEKEKTVIEEEIEFYEDTPSELIFDEFETLLFGEHPLARNILGTKRSLKKLTRNDIFNFISSQYGLDRVVLSSSGNISLKKLQNLCERYFGSYPLNSEPQKRDVFSDYHPKNHIVNKKTSQTHLMLGTLAYSFKEENEKKKNAFTLLTNLVGGQGMSSRLNTAIRERRGWAYTVEANYTAFSDTGLFTVYLGCETSRTEQCIDEVFKVLQDVRTKKLGTLQLNYTKKQLIGQMALNNESKLNEMLALGRTALFFDEVESVEETAANINAITAEDILEVANECFDRDAFSTLVFKGRLS